MASYGAGSSPSNVQNIGPLQVGRHYRVIRAFDDYDKNTHPVGETWRYLRHTFLPYDDGLMLMVTSDDGRLTQIRMQWRPEEQGSVLDHLDRFIVSAA